MKDGGPAFPNVPVDAPNHGLITASEWGADTGMSLRDWFAGQALAGIWASFESTDEPELSIVAEMAYETADAMLSERERKEEA